MVMEAVNIVLGGGLCVGVVLEGKKIREMITRLCCRPEFLMITRWIPWDSLLRRALPGILRFAKADYCLGTKGVIYLYVRLKVAASWGTIS